MITILLSRSRRGRNPSQVYYLYSGLFALFYSLTGTLTLLYMATTVGLSPLQMVLVGTVLEATIFICEIPTGLLSDLHSRRLSIAVGLLLIGIGFLLQGLLPSFSGLILAQVVWGIGFTFTSGSDEAWIADEIGAEFVAPVFIRAQQFELLGTILGIVAAAGLGLIDLQIPLLVSGTGFIITAAFIWTIMPETGFTRTEQSVTAPFTSMASGLRQGLLIARRRPIIRSFLFVGLFAGLSSEAFDRLWTVHILDIVQMSALSTTESVLIFAGISLVGTIISLAVSLLLRLLQPERLMAVHPAGLLIVLTICQIVGIIGLALTSNLWIALAALWLRSAALSITAPLHSAWLARNLDSNSRATTLSLMSQANAIGQVSGGPPLGALANHAGVTISLIVSGAVLAPIVALYNHAKNSSTGNSQSRPER